MTHTTGEHEQLLCWHTQVCSHERLSNTNSAANALPTQLRQLQVQSRPNPAAPSPDSSSWDPDNCLSWSFVSCCLQYCPLLGVLHVQPNTPLLTTGAAAIAAAVLHVMRQQLVLSQCQCQLMTATTTVMSSGLPPEYTMSNASVAARLYGVTLCLSTLLSKATCSR
jgi:hypothetical protein